MGKSFNSKHWTNTVRGKEPLLAHSVTPGKSSLKKSLLNRWKRRKGRISLKSLYTKAIIDG